MKKVLIVEDEPMIAQDLTLTLRGADFEVLGPFDNAADALVALQHDQADLALLDINIKGTHDGIELATRFNRSFPIIFVTSYYDSQTLSRVEHVKPHAYILKPFKEEEILINVRLALSRSGSNQAPKPDDKILIKWGSKAAYVQLSDIQYVQGDDNYTRIFLNGKKELLVSQTLKAFLEKLPERSFCRVHKSYAINVDLMEGISGNKVYLSGQSIPIGRSYKKEFLERIRL